MTVDQFILVVQVPARLIKKFQSQNTTIPFRVTNVFNVIGCIIGRRNELAAGIEGEIKVWKGILEFDAFGDFSAIGKLDHNGSYDIASHRQYNTSNQGISPEPRPMSSKQKECIIYHKAQPQHGAEQSESIRDDHILIG